MSAAAASAPHGRKKSLTARVFVDETDIPVLTRAWRVRLWGIRSKASYVSLADIPGHTGRSHALVAAQDDEVEIEGPVKGQGAHLRSFAGCDWAQQDATNLDQPVERWWRRVRPGRIHDYEPEVVLR